MLEMISALGRRLKDRALLLSLPSEPPLDYMSFSGSAGFCRICRWDCLSLINSLTHRRGIRLFAGEKDVSGAPDH